MYTLVTENTGTSCLGFPSNKQVGQEERRENRTDHVLKTDDGYRQVYCTICANFVDVCEYP